MAVGRLNLGLCLGFGFLLIVFVGLIIGSGEADCFEDDVAWI